MKALLSVAAMIAGLLLATTGTTSKACGDLPIVKPTKPGTGSGGKPQYQW